jgi:hypothetical protein
MQLLIFYEENSDLLPQENYFSCDKLACYLCYSFIINHGRFRVNSCHQSLYSLWTVPDHVAFENQERAEVFNNALRALCEDLEDKMAATRDSQNKCWKHTTNNESVANLPRLSLPLAIPMIGEGSTLQARSDETLSGSQNRCLEGGISIACQKGLTLIPEVPLMEHSEDYVELDQAAQLKTNQPAAEVYKGIAKLEFDATGSTSVPSNVNSNCQTTRGDRRQKEMLPVKQSLNHCQ